MEQPSFLFRKTIVAKSPTSRICEPTFQLVRSLIGGARLNNYYIDKGTDLAVNLKIMGGGLIR